MQKQKHVHNITTRTKHAYKYMSQQNKQKQHA